MTYREALEKIAAIPGRCAAAHDAANIAVEIAREALKQPDRLADVEQANRMAADLLAQMEARALEAEAEARDLQITFDLRWRADMRAIHRWRGAHPGNELVSPAHTDLCVWLMEERDKMETESVRLRGVIAWLNERRADVEWFGDELETCHVVGWNERQETFGKGDGPDIEAAVEDARKERP